MKLRSTYKTNMYYFAIQSMLKNNEIDRKCSKRAKKQFDFVRNFIDSKNNEELKKFVEDAESGKGV